MASHPRRRVKACIDCGTPGTPGDGLSFRGLCVDCSVARQTGSIVQQVEKSGPYYDRWRQSMVEAIERELAASG